MNTLVVFTCAAPAHRDAEVGPDKLTVHEGKWAYCGYDAKADGHEWQANEGIALSLLQHPGAIKSRSDAKDPSETR